MELINESRFFAANELFFSTTDLQGRIQRANSIFERIADYSWEELANKPHNIIRHPDMPRVVFQTLWDYIQAGKPVVAFVKNLAHDGRYYWVLALVTPFPGGYLSVRFKPTSSLLPTMEGLYVDLRAIEAAIEGESNDRKAAIAASGKALDTTLHALGFRGYDDFMQQALKQEMQSREASVRGAGPVVVQADSPDEALAFQSSSSAAEMFDKLVEVLTILFADLEVYVDINKGVRSKSGNVTERAESLRVSALNGVVAVDKLGTSAAGLRPVLDSLRALSGEITQEGVRLSESLDELVKGVEQVVFGLSAAKLQVEMTAQFAHELANHGLASTIQDSTSQMTEGAISSLYSSSCETVRVALRGLASIKDRLKTLARSQIKLLDSSHFLRPIYLTGKIEMADAKGSRMTAVFEDVDGQLKDIAINLNELKIVLEQLEAHLIRGLAHGELVEETIGLIDAHMSASASRVV